MSDEEFVRRDSVLVLRAFQTFGSKASEQLDASDELEEIVAENRLVRLIEDDIYSVLPDTAILHHYDKRATV